MLEVSQKHMLHWRLSVLWTHDHVNVYQQSVCYKYIVSVLHLCKLFTKVYIVGNMSNMKGPMADIDI